jgi:hypothetical protein
MRLRKIDNGAILTKTQVRQLYPNTSFPRDDWNADVLAFAGVDAIAETEKPEDTDTVRYVETISQVDGTWTSVWSEESLYTEEELAERAAAEVTAKWNDLREERNGKLEAVDKDLIASTELKKIGRLPFSSDKVYSEVLEHALYEWKQKLRDFPETVENIDSYSFPDDPRHEIDMYRDQYNTNNPDSDTDNPDSGSE